jgi:hypothetical protein
MVQSEEQPSGRMRTDFEDETTVRSKWLAAVMT